MRRVLVEVVVCILLLGGCRRIGESTYKPEASTAGHRVVLTGELNAKPTGVWTSTVVVAQLDTERAAGQLELFSADSRDFTFRQEYPSEEWIRPDVLRFRSVNGRSAGTRVVSISAAGGETLQLIAVECGDLFLLVNLQREKRIDIPCQAERSLIISAVTETGRAFRPQAVGLPDGTSYIRVVVGESGARLG